MEYAKQTTLFEELKIKMDGELFRDMTTRLIYATDASAYKVLPLAV